MTKKTELSEAEVQRLTDETIEEARRVIQRALSLADPSFTYIVVALNNRDHVAVASSTHGCLDSLSEAETERAYRHFCIAEHIVQQTLDTIEARLPDEVTGRNEGKPAAPEYKN